ncbi:cupin domain-containing protein [Streptosporangium sp. LJ11]|uniref:cupin domain-containing protein n=1 Tax=Streptosporangium sp. LJ11 TaxID=3436927 RepID=UPI003F7910A2
MHRPLDTLARSHNLDIRHPVSICQKMPAHRPRHAARALWMASRCLSVQRATRPMMAGSFPPGVGEVVLDLGRDGGVAHPEQEETFYMLDGELEFLDGDHRFTAVAGDCVHVPRGLRHSFQNKRMHAVRMLFMFTPPGPEQVFVDHATPARDGETPPPLDDEQLARLETMARLIKPIRLWIPGRSGSREPRAGGRGCVSRVRGQGDCRNGRGRGRWGGRRGGEKPPAEGAGGGVERGRQPMERPPAATARCSRRRRVTRRHRSADQARSPQERRSPGKGRPRLDQPVE